MPGFTFKGKSLEELKELSIREFANLLNARKRRSLVRQSDRVADFLSRCEKRLASKKPIKTHWRSLVIVPRLVGLTLHVHNGKEFVSLPIQPEMLGHYVGEFVLTRKRVIHGAAGLGATRSSKALAVK